MTRLYARPLTLKQANAHVAALHRHHVPVVGHRYSIGAYVGETLVGAAIISRPVAPMTEQFHIAEVTRLVTDGTKDACSFLYQRCARAAESMGFLSIQTFTLPEEGGGSLRGAGWICEGETAVVQTGKGWESRPLFGAMFPELNRRAQGPNGVKLRWRRSFPANVQVDATAETVYTVKHPKDSE